MKLNEVLEDPPPPLAVAIMQKHLAKGGKLRVHFGSKFYVRALERQGTSNHLWLAGSSDKAATIPDSFMELAKAVTEIDTNGDKVLVVKVAFPRRRSTK